jgi:DNA-binding GntR family transcriptional regulator
MNVFDRSKLRAMLPKGRNRRTMAVDVTECLRNAIQSGLLADGVELNQVALAEHLGVSRVPVREAMRVLEAEGWISARAHYRAVVQTIGSERVNQIFEMRTFLEVRCLGRSMRTMTREKIMRLYAICDEMDSLTDHKAWLAANRLFHRELLQHPGGDLAIELVGQLTSQVERYLRVGGGGPKRETQAGVEHRAILAAISQRNSRKARDLLRDHIGNTRRIVLAVIQERQQAARNAATSDPRIAMARKTVSRQSAIRRTTSIRQR